MESKDWDIVDEASLESFPASDSPAWGQADKDFSEPDIIVELESPKRSRVPYIVGAVIAAAGLVSFVYYLRRMRR